MSKKSNKKSPKKKLSKKPGAKKAASKKAAAKKKKAAKKPTRKTSRPQKKSAAKPKKTAPKSARPAKSIKKKAAKKPATKKVAPKKAVKKIVKAKPAKKVIAKKAPARIHNHKKTSLAKGHTIQVAAKKPVAAEKSALKVLKSNPQPVTGKPAVEKPVEVKQDENKVVRVVKQMVKGEPLPSPKKSVIIDIKTGPEPPGRFELEYVVHASAQILFEFITTPSGLSEWFCDDVNIRNGVYSFKWEDNEQSARVVKLVEEKLVRFQWVEKQDNSYFEFRLERDDLTNDISLIIVDFADTPEEKASSTLLWNSQVDKLLHVLGAYF
jgi:uncharacterized protein YndB with AHSA1/START domain